MLPTQTARRATKISSIQALRAIAVYLVVLVHVETLLLRLGAPPLLTYFGNAGVDIFFVVSGFIMVLTTEESPPGPLRFLGLRVARIVPLYWLVTLGVFVLAAVAPSLFAGTTAALRPLVLSLAFVPFVRADGVIAPLVFVGWTLNYEMFFYVLFAASLMLPGRRSQLLGLLAALVALVVAGPLIGAGATPAGIYTDPLLLEFAAGCILGRLFHRLPAHPGLVGPSLAAGALCLAAIASTDVWAAGWPRALAWGVPASLMVLSAMVYERAGGRTPRWLLILGDASYAIYLTHFFVTQAVIQGAATFGLTGPAASACLLAAALVAIAGVGMTAHAGLELPLTRIAQRLLGVSRRRPSTG